MSVLHHHLRDSGFHEGCVRQEKLVLLLTELDTRLAQRRETLQKRVTGPEDLLAAPVSQQTRITCPTPTSVEHANIRVKSYNLNSRERYVCNSGFKRKAGTSSLTECVFNKTMNIAHWTTPNLKCIRDPSLTHQRPPPMTTPAGVTPGPESHISSGKGRNVGNFFRTPIPCYHQDPTEPSDSCLIARFHVCIIDDGLKSTPEPTFPSKSDAPGASGPATEPGSRLTPPKHPTAGTTGVVRPEPSQVPPQTTAKALEHTPSVSQDPPGAGQYRARAVTAAVSVLVAVLGAVCVGLLLVCYRRSRKIKLSQHKDYTILRA
ncbi:Interleukin-15 receptor subunit alpha [Camelus dromedarius]|uniref:Interleukin-15 receptor subunit alpha n=1 Tax=Camelus dromedarius TaxID=9838 RepID=A0A5N4C523_CAMDR|nr:Interleukin-15 receptor subunit alpha [Camelus dromedarius]